MKIVKILGGLGNQMFQYALYLALKEHFPDEEIKIDTSCFCAYPLHNGYELNKLFHIDAKEASFIEKAKIAYPYLNYRFWQIAKRILPKRKSMLTEPKNEEFTTSVFTQNDNCYYDGYWQNERYFKNIRNKVLATFCPITVSEKNIEYGKLLKNKKSVSIHVRRGDYINNTLYGNICTKDYYLKAIERIKEIKEIDTFCVFSNDIMWCKENLSSFLNECNVIYVDWNHGKNSYQDIYLMSQCNNNIIANSSFSWWGAWLNQNIDKTVICPKKWNNIPNSLFEMPDDWIKI